MVLQSWGEILSKTFQDLWLQVALFVPRFIVAVLFFVIGWILGSIVGSVVAQVIRGLHVDKALRSMGLEDTVERSGFRLDTGKFLGTIIRWFIVVVFLIVSLNVLGLSDVNFFLQQVVLGYLPHVVVAVLVLLISAIVGDAAFKIIVGSARAAGSPSAHFVASVGKWAIWIFGILVAFEQLGIAPEFIQTLYTGIIAMLALAGGLSLGLGGRSTAERLLDKMREEMGGK